MKDGSFSSHQSVLFGRFDASHPFTAVCVCVISVCDPVLGDHGSMVRFVHVVGDSAGFYCLSLQFPCWCILGGCFQCWVDYL